MELRVAAHFSRDPRLIAVLNDTSRDVFHQLHAEWHQVPIESVTSSQRSVAKRVCYGILYGMGAFTLSRELSCTKEEAAKHISSFMTRYSKHAFCLRILLVVLYNYTCRLLQVQWNSCIHPADSGSVSQMWLRKHLERPTAIYPCNPFFR